MPNNPKVVRAWAVIDPEGEPMPHTCSDMRGVVYERAKSWRKTGWNYRAGKVEIRVCPKKFKRKK